MRILVVGGGGREHALAWRFAEDGHTVIAAPGNPGIGQVAECTEIAVDDDVGLTRLAVGGKIDLVVVGPEGPLVAGLADKLRAAGVLVFGPGAAGAALEGSKIFSKLFFARHGIRTAAFHACDDLAAVDRALAELGDRVVVKADGLAAGKGVFVCGSKDEARAAAAELFAGRFGDAGRRILIEQRLGGREVSIMAVTDGHRVLILPPAEDHKTLLDGDRGPNTGGMGTVSPCGWLPPGLLERAEREIFEPTLAGLRREQIDFRGVLYAGLMIDEGGAPWLLEYNCRFGDPETQPVMARLRGDLGALLAAAARGNLGDARLEVDGRAAVCVVMAAPGYPDRPRTGEPIRGLDRSAKDVVVFHAGTARRDDELVTAGGRVLGVTATGATVDDARARAYAEVERIQFDGAQYRRDIGRRGTVPQPKETE